MAEKMDVDYFIFGHRHFAIDYEINQKARYINLGDWIKLYTYGVFDGTSMQLLKWES
jgi:UDP-2,3-diacylglucosamine hydrolase